MKKLICAVAILALAFCLLPAAPAKAAPTDEIENYTITVAMEGDGTMDLTYHIDWKVLDSTSEGPLTWVKVGIPNASVDNLKALGPSITGISYMDDGGDYVRLDLDRSYNAGEVVPLDFSIHQSNMADTSGGLCSYRFTPGWFDSIEVKALTIRWNADKVSSSDSQATDDGALVWKTSLAAGQRFTVSVIYPAGAFNIPDGGKTIVNSNGSSYSGDNGDSGSSSGWGNGGVVIIALVFGGFVVFINIIRRLSGSGRYRGGFGINPALRGGIRTSCACVHSYACACGCACACACAGGGRAGCSAKSFYAKGLQLERLRKVLCK